MRVYVLDKRIQGPSNPGMPGSHTIRLIFEGSGLTDFRTGIHQLRDGISLPTHDVHTVLQITEINYVTAQTFYMVRIVCKDSGRMVHLYFLDFEHLLQSGTGHGQSETI